MGRPNFLPCNQKTIAFRVDCKWHDELHSLADDLDLTSSDLLRISFPIVLKILSRLSEDLRKSQFCDLDRRGCRLDIKTIKTEVYNG